MLLYWAVLSAIPQGADRLAEIGTNLPLWMGALELTPFLLVPAFLFLAVRTGAQWRALMITVYAGLFLNLLMNLALSSGAMWGDLPAAGPYGTLDTLFIVRNTFSRFILWSPLHESMQNTAGS